MDLKNLISHVEIAEASALPPLASDAVPETDLRVIDDAARKAGDRVPDRIRLLRNLT